MFVTARRLRTVAARGCTASADAYAAPGVALAWACCAPRAKRPRRWSFASPTDPPVYPWVAVDRHRPLHQSASKRCSRRRRSTGTLDARVPRSQVRRPSAYGVPLLRIRRQPRDPLRRRSRVLSGHSRHHTGVHRRGKSSMPTWRIASRTPRGEKIAMTRNELARLLDHSVLKPEATEGRPRRRRRRSHMADRLLLRPAVLGASRHERIGG